MRLEYYNNVRHRFDFETKYLYNSSMSNQEQAPNPLKREFEDRNLPESYSETSKRFKYGKQASDSLGQLHRRLQTLTPGSNAMYLLKSYSVQAHTDALADCFILNVNVSSLMDRLKPRDIPQSASDWQTQVGFTSSDHVQITMARYKNDTPEFKTYKIKYGMFTYEVNNTETDMEVSDYTDLIYLTDTITNDL